MKKKLLCIDGNSILNRAFYGVRPLTTRDGRNTNAIYGFVNMILKQLQNIEPDYAVVAFDLKAPTFRHLKYEPYKANRKGMPEELFEQLEPIKTICPLMGFKVLSLEGFEADDILGTLSRISEEELMCECFIMTGDRDSFQLVSDNTKILYAVKNDTVIYDLSKIKEDYGIEPRKLIEVKALMGDASDNIPGVSGIGEKTALKLVSAYDSLDNIYEKIDELDVSKGIKLKLQNDKENAFLSRFLGEINRFVPINSSPSDLKYKGFQKSELFKMFSDFELKSLITRMELDKIPTDELSLFDVPVQKTDFEKIEFKEINSLPQISKDELTYCIISEDQQKIYIFCKEYYILPNTHDVLKSYFENEEIKKILFDSKEVSLWLLKQNSCLKNCVFDLMLGSYIADSHGNEGVYSLIATGEYSSVDLSNENQKNLVALSAMQSEYLHLTEKLKENCQENLYLDIELPLAIILSKMEFCGFKTDKNKLSEFSNNLSKKIKILEGIIYEQAECEFNINSPKQLSEILFVSLNLPTFKKNKSGFSTDAETLEKLRPYHPIINNILEYRTLAKLKSTYADGLLSKLTDENFLHTNFKQALTQTGRLSSTEPNLQNIPIRSEEGRELRKFFIPKNSDYILIDADYSQIELRILAAISDDQNMINTFISGEDVHTTTAANIFGVTPKEVTAEMRKKAKAVNFGVVYGIGDYSLSLDIGVTRREAGEYIKGYFAKYPNVEKYLQDVVENAKTCGFVTTLFGRRRYIPELKLSNKNLQAFGARVAMNTPIQGTAADIIKIAMINVENSLEKENVDAKLILQVHDELIVESSKKDSERAKEILIREMQNAVKLSVPLDVTIGIGESWFDAHE